VLGRQAVVGVAGAPTGSVPRRMSTIAHMPMIDVSRSGVLRALRIALGVFGLVTCVATRAADAELVPPGESVAGKTQREWSVAWWQWAGSFAYEESPVADRVGSKCAAKQAGEVWFLAGTYGTRRTVRTCKVPAGKHLFFPLINTMVTARVGAVSDCGSLARTAAAMTQDVSALVLDVDGKRFEGLERHRQVSDGCFDVLARSDSGTGGVQGAANGYYVMLRPLRSGTYVVNFGGVLPSVLQAVTYTLQVE
jgi:hypothetical protein